MPLLFTLSSHLRHCVLFFFFHYTPSSNIYTLSLHDALPISAPRSASRRFSSRPDLDGPEDPRRRRDRKSTRLNSSHLGISYAVFCLKKKRTGLHGSWRVR